MNDQHTNDSAQTRALEQKIRRLAQLAGLLAALNVLIAGILVYQAEVIERNRNAILQMEKSLIEAADRKVSNITPMLDQRTQHLESELMKMQTLASEMDLKMQASQEVFISRMNKEFPRMIDRYFEQKLDRAKHTILH